MTDRFKDYEGINRDLDSLDTYCDTWTELGTQALWEECWMKAGKSLFYMEFIHPETNWKDQQTRIKRMCYHLAVEQRGHMKDTPENRLWFMKWLYRFTDEVENQC